MARTVAVLIVIGVGALGISIGRAQADPSAIRIEKVKDNLYVITGGRGSGGQAGTVSGNTTVFISGPGVVLVDTKLPGFGRAILDQVKSVTSKPVTMIVNTHTHNDHTGSNSEFPRPVEFVAHENTKTNMLKMTAFQGENGAFVPRRTFSDKLDTSERTGSD